jgi:hypothetical protein
VNRLFVQTVLLVAMLGPPALGQTDNKTDNKDEIIQRLLDRVDALEREVKALQQGRKPADAPTPQPSEQAQAAVTPSPAAPTPDADATNASDNTSRFTFHGYADADFDRDVNGMSDDKRFALGEVDLFGSERLSDRLTALVELVLETDNQSLVADIPVNVERMLLEIRGNRYFNLDIGSYRTAIGFYNMAFLRGSWLQTAVSRPLIYTFEDQGGILPLHNVGLSANGEIPSGLLGLHYIAEVGSSRNAGQNNVSPYDSADNGAVNMALYARPRRWSGFQTGFSSYHDRFSPLLGVDYLNRSLWTAYAVYQGHGIEFLNEGMLVTYRQSADSYGRIPTAYSQIGYRVRPGWMPYARYEFANAAGRNQSDLARQFTPWRLVELGGVRYDLNDFTALKFEIGHETSWFQPAWIRAAAQVAFTF